MLKMDHADSCGKSPNADPRSGGFNLAGPGAVAGTDYDEIGGDIHRCRSYLNKQGRSGNEPSMIDPFGRTITYLRVSVTDRCDFRCVYCMAEEMNFLPKSELLTLEELDRVCGAFIRHGVRKLRLTGGEPLVRRDIMTLFRALGRHIKTGALDELTLTTNGSQLARYAEELRDCGVRRVNVSVDTLDPEKFTEITRRGRLDQVLDELVAWAGGEGFDLVIIEVMPMGDIGGENRLDQYLPLSLVRARLQRRWTLDDSDYRTGGPARYVTVHETGRRLGFITPLTHNFCESCNRVRLTCTGTLFMCLGQEDAADLRKPLRASEGNDLLYAAIREAIGRKPKGHDFIIDRRHNRPAIARHMSVTGG